MRVGDEMKKRVIVIVLDSLGIGALPDAEKFGDKGANTLEHILESNGALHIPNLSKLGLANIEGIDKIPSIKEPTGVFGRAKEMSNGKDTTTGHWEMMGLYIKTPFRTFPEGFPESFIKEFEKKIGRKTIGNYPISGTEIIKRLGDKHVQTGDLIVYTSADSVFQIAAHEEVIPIDELYNICRIARNMLVDDLQVARVIARPFIGENGEYIRTANRRDFSISPFEDTVLDHVKEKGLEVFAIGKIEDIFNGKGITKAVHTHDNMDGVNQTIIALKEDFSGLIFTNLVDFDSKYGHRRNPKGYKEAIEAFDKRLPEIIDNLKDDDILILTADHGNDPTYTGTDHTREYIPVVAYGQHIRKGVNLGTLESFADIGATVSDILDVQGTKYGKSFKEQIINLD